MRDVDEHGRPVESRALVSEMVRMNRRRRGMDPVCTRCGDTGEVCKECGHPESVHKPMYEPRHTYMSTDCICVDDPSAENPDA